MSSSRKKPRKPNPSFPLTAHNNGQWCKKIRGKIHFFGVWENRQAALDHYLRVAADLHAGREPRDSNLAADAVMVKGVCNAYLTYQFQKVQDGNIRPSSFDDCRAIVESFAKVMGPARAVSDLAASGFPKLPTPAFTTWLHGQVQRLGCVWNSSGDQHRAKHVQVRL